MICCFELFFFGNESRYLPLVAQNVANMSPILNIFQVQKNGVGGKDVDGISLMALNFQNG